MEQNNELKVTVLDFNIDWVDIKNACRTTVNLKSSDISATDEWKKKLLICKHSPLRIGTMLIRIENVPYYVMGHLVRHNVGVTPFVGTSREDRTGIPREERKQTDLVTMDLFVNIESLMNISAKRLCNCADKETIKVWRAVLEEVRKYDELIYWSCVPQCVDRGGCCEPFAHCKFYDNFCDSKLTEDDKTNLILRYDKYNRYRG